MVEKIEEQQIQVEKSKRGRKLGVKFPNGYKKKEALVANSERKEEIINGPILTG